MKGNLVHGTLVRRYKRFLADVILDDGQAVTVHCPNTGSMKHCVETGAEVWLSSSDNPKRKYRYTWELTRTSRGHFIGINTGRANQIVEEGIGRGRVAELDGYRQCRREVKYGDENSRIDLFLSEHDKLANTYVEVKSVTLLETPVSKGIGYFPDAISERGAKHLRELKGVSEAGDRAVLFFCVQHSGVREVRPADHIDQRYGEHLREALAAGVEVIAYKVSFRGKTPAIAGALPVVVP